MNELDQDEAAKALKAMGSAFPARPFPKGVAVAQPGTWFDEAGTSHTYADPGANEVAGFFGARPWTQIDPRQLLRWPRASEALIHFTPQALAHYLPAYFSASLTVPLDGVGAAVLESVVRALTPPADSGDETLAKRGGSSRTDAQRTAMEAKRAQQFAEFVGTLTGPQKAAVVTFLRAFEPVFEDPDLDNPARTALDLYWRKHVPG